MTGAEALLAWAAVGAYALATALWLALVVFGTRKGERLAVSFAIGGAACHLASLSLRVASSGHLPVKGNYENASTAALFIAVPAVVMALRKPALRAIALAALALALLAFGWGLLQRDPATPLTPPYRSTWLVVHVAFANLSYGAYSLASAASLGWLAKDALEARGRPQGPLASLPAQDALEDLAFRFVLFGFLTSAFMIAAGAFWADALWGSYWSWDPVETWSLVSWLTYGALLHLRVVHKWRGRRLAWPTALAIAWVAVSFWGVNFLDSSAHRFLLL